MADNPTQDETNAAQVETNAAQVKTNTAQVDSNVHTADILRDIYEVAAGLRGDFNSRFTSTDARLEGLDAKVTAVHTRMDNLVNTTNHRLDDFTLALALKADAANLNTIEQRIEGEMKLKANNTEMIVPKIGRFLDTWPKRFVAFSAGVATSATIIHFIWDWIY